MGGLLGAAKLDSDNEKLIIAGHLPRFVELAKIHGTPFASAADTVGLTSLAEDHEEARLILLPFFLPFEPAVDMVTRMKAALPNVQVWIVTATADNLDATSEWSHLCDRFVSSSVPWEEIEEVLR